MDALAVHANDSNGCHVLEIQLTAMVHLSDRSRHLVLAHMDLLGYDAPRILLGFEEGDGRADGPTPPNQDALPRRYSEFTARDFGQGSLAAAWR